MIELQLNRTIRQRLVGLSRSERRVADVVLAGPDLAVESTLAQLAARANVSEPTVIRFCRSVGCRGFADFKVRLARSLAFPSHVYSGVTSGDDTRTFMTKIVGSTVEALAGLNAALDPSAVDAAIDLLARAGRIEFYGFAASGAVAVDAHQKFLHLTNQVAAYTDSHLQLMSAANLTPDDAVVAISHTGRTTELLTSVDMALASGASVVAITRPGSPLAGRCDHVLAVCVSEDTDTFPPSASRIAHLVVVDILAVGLALRRERDSDRRMQRIKTALRGKRVDPMPTDPAPEGGGTTIR